MTPLRALFGYVTLLDLSLISVYLHNPLLCLAKDSSYFPLIFDRAVTMTLCVSVGDQPGGWVRLSLSGVA